MNPNNAGISPPSITAPTEISGGLDKNNIGFQMMKKLGKQHNNKTIKIKFIVILNIIIIVIIVVIINGKMLTLKYNK